MNEKLKKVLPCKIDCKNNKNFLKVLETLDQEDFVWWDGYKIRDFAVKDGRFVFIYCSQIITYGDEYEKDGFDSDYHEEISLEQFFSFFKPSKSQKLLNLENDIKTKLKRMDLDGK